MPDVIVLQTHKYPRRRWRSLRAVWSTRREWWRLVDRRQRWLALLGR